jgi:hypothetical protein
LWQAARKAARRKEQQTQKDEELERLWAKQCSNEAREKRAQTRKRRAGDELLTDMSHWWNTRGWFGTGLLHMILLHLNARDLCHALLAGICRPGSVFDAARAKVEMTERPPGCVASRVPRPPGIPRTRDYVARLRQLEVLDSPIRLTTCRVGAFAISSLAGSSTVTALSGGFATAVSGPRERRMKAGVHAAEFYINNASAEGNTRYCRIGVVRSTFDTRANCSASRTADGWGWSRAGKGQIYHDGFPYHPGDHSVSQSWIAGWQTGDRLTLRLDVDSGDLIASKNGTRLGVLATGLTLEASKADDGDGDAQGWRWFVETGRPETSVTVVAVTPTADADEAAARAICRNTGGHIGDHGGIGCDCSACSDAWE